MRCHVCGSQLESTMTDLPFKISKKTIVILRGLPILQCAGCGEYLIEDAVSVRVKQLLSGADKSAELEIIPFAA